MDAIKTNIMFNYIITVHNKEVLIRDVLLGVINSAGPNSFIYPVLDGCTDLSEYIIDDLIKSFPNIKIIKVYADDVHELKSINIGLIYSNQIGDGYNIILQDDVILKDHNLEKKCIHLFKSFNDLGIISFRHGGNISRDLIKSSEEYIPMDNYIQNECGHYPYLNPILKNGFFTFKELAIKSPICIPFKVVREIGKPDEAYAPWYDAAYCYKVSESGYSNGVFAINFQSEVDWGTARSKEQKVSHGEVEYKNLKLFKAQNPKLSSLDKNKYNNKKYHIFDGDRLIEANEFIL